MRAAVPLLLALALAGCLAAPGAEAPADPPPPTTKTHLWGLESCAYVIAVVRANAPAVQSLLPEGFTAATDATGRSEIHFDAYRCATGSWLGGGPDEDLPYGSVYVPVTAPEALREEGYDAQFVKLDFLVANDTARAALAAAGLPARGGDAQARLFTVPLGGIGVEASLDLGGNAGFSFVGGAVPPTPQGSPLPFVEFTPLEAGGLARWHARLHNATFASGAGMLEARGWARDVVGDGPVAATFIAGAWNLDQANVTFPIPWP